MINRDVFLTNTVFNEIKLSDNNINKYFTFSNIGEKYIHKIINNELFGITIQILDKNK